MHLPLNFHDINNLTKTNSKWILIEKYMFNTDNIVYVHCDKE